MLLSESVAHLFTIKTIPIVRIATTTNKMNITGTSTPIRTFLLFSSSSLLLLLLPLLAPLLGPVGPTVIQLTL